MNKVIAKAAQRSPQPIEASQYYDQPITLTSLVAQLRQAGKNLCHTFYNYFTAILPIKDCTLIAMYVSHYMRAYIAPICSSSEISSIKLS